jgi:hypothetical protein
MPYPRIPDSRGTDIKQIKSKVEVIAYLVIRDALVDVPDGSLRRVGVCVLNVGTGVSQ